MKTIIYNRYRIYISSFLMDLACAFVVGAVAVYAIELGAGPVELGFIGAVGAALYVVSSLAGGKLCDRFSRKKMILAACALTAASCLLLARASRLSDLYIYYGLFFISMGFFWPILQSLLADSRHRRSLTATLGNFCISWSLGFTIGHFICGYLTRISSVLPFTWAVAASLIILIDCYTLSDSEAAASTAGADYLVGCGNRPRILWRRFLVCGWLANFALVFSLSAAKMLFPKLALDVDHLDKATLGLMLALIHAGQLTMFWLVKYWHGWQYNRRIYLLTQLLALPGAGLLAFTGCTAGYAAGMYLIGLGAGFTYTSSLYYSTSRPADAATRTGVHEAFIGMGILLGPLCGGFVSGQWDLHAPYVLCFLLVSAAFFMQTLLLYRTLPSDTSQTAANC